MTDLSSRLSLLLGLRISGLPGDELQPRGQLLPYDFPHQHAPGQRFSRADIDVLASFWNAPRVSCNKQPVCVDGSWKRSPSKKHAPLPGVPFSKPKPSPHAIPQRKELTWVFLCPVSEPIVAHKNLSISMGVSTCSQSSRLKFPVFEVINRAMMYTNLPPSVSRWLAKRGLFWGSRLLVWVGQEGRTRKPPGLTYP